MGAGAPSSGKGARIDLVPILDALVVVIFFLVLSISFTELTKVTMPPVQVVENPQKSESSAPAVKAILLASFENGRINLIIKWNNESSSYLQETLDRATSSAGSLEKAVAVLAEKFKLKYPNEKTLQVSATKDASFQEFVTLIDSAKPFFADVVMISYVEAENQFAQKM